MYLVSLHLFADISSLSSRPMDDLMLSQRWSYLSFFLESNDFVEASILAGLVSLFYDVFEHCERSEVRCDVGIDLFAYACSCSNGILDLSHHPTFQNIDMSERRRATIARILRCFGKLGHCRLAVLDDQKPTALTLSSIFECFDFIVSGGSIEVSDFVQAKCCVSFDLSGLLRVMLPRNVIPCGRRQPLELAIWSKLQLLLDIIHEIGITLSTGALECEELLQSMLDCHRTITILAVKLVPSLTDTSIDLTILQATINCVAAVSLLTDDILVEAPCCNVNEVEDTNRRSKTLNSAYTLAKAGLSALSKSTCSDWGPLVQTTKSILIYIKNKCTLVPALTTQEFNEFVQAIFAESAQESFSEPCSAETLNAHIAVSFFSRQAESCHKRGEGFLAFRLAEWSYRTGRALDRDDQKWLEIAFLRKLSTSTISGDVCLGDDDNIALSQCDASLENIELKANVVRCKLEYCADGPAAVRMGSVLENILEQLSDSLTDQGRGHLANVCWLQGTLIQTLASSYAIRGNLRRAISLYKDCLRLDKHALISSTRSLSSRSRFVPIHMKSLTTVERLEERQIGVLLSLAELLQRSGDYRRADTYVYSAIKCLKCESLAAAVETNGDLRDLVENLYSLRLDSPRLTELRRITWEFAVARSSPDQAFASLSLLKDSPSDPSMLSVSKDDIELDAVLEGVARLKLGQMATKVELDSYLFSETRKPLVSIKSIPITSNTCFRKSGAIISPVPEHDLELISARHTFLRLDHNFCTEDQLCLKRVCEKISKSPFASASQRSEALYMTGVLHLQEAKRDGTLHRLWHGCSNQEGTRLQFEMEQSTYLRDAKQCFIDALSICGPASDQITRNILRSLALASGPEDNEEDCMGIWEMIHGSIGSTTRQRVRELISPKPDDEDGDDLSNEISSILMSLDDPFFSEERHRNISLLVQSLEKNLPTNWRVVAVALCPTGEVLINTIEVNIAFTSKTVCVFRKDPTEVYMSVIQPLDELINQSQGQLQGDSFRKAGFEIEDKQKREWWSRRERIDNDIKALCRRTEMEFFSSPSIQSALQGDLKDPMTDNMNQFCDQQTCSIPLINKSPLKENIDPSSMKVVELREALVDMGLSLKDIRKLRKADLVELFKEEHQRSSQFSQKEACEQTHALSETCAESGSTLLVLDENFHRFPFEALPCLQGRSICRHHSISLLAVQLAEQSDKCSSGNVEVDMSLSTYILDPESNLEATRKRIYEFIASLEQKQGYEWDGIVGKAPPRDFFEKNLVLEKSMFLFFGHGGGQSYFSRSAIEGLIVPGERQIKAAVVLMGCSSGRLLSVNRKRLNDQRHVPILFEPEGVALSYLAAGAPCVIGNLWDVTDKDIDQLSIDLLKRFHDGQELSASLSQARSVCKMKYLNGFAPVYYGIPVFPKR